MRAALILSIEIQCLDIACYQGLVPLLELMNTPGKRRCPEKTRIQHPLSGYFSGSELFVNRLDLLGLTA